MSIPLLSYTAALAPLTKSPGVAWSSGWNGNNSNSAIEQLPDLARQPKFAAEVKGCVQAIAALAGDDEHSLLVLATMPRAGESRLLVVNSNPVHEEVWGPSRGLSCIVHNKHIVIGMDSADSPSGREWRVLARDLSGWVVRGTGVLPFDAKLLGLHGDQPIWIDGSRLSTPTQDLAVFDERISCAALLDNACVVVMTLDVNASSAAHKISPMRSMLHAVDLNAPNSVVSLRSNLAVVTVERPVVVGDAWSILIEGNPRVVLRCDVNATGVALREAPFATPK